MLTIASCSAPPEGDLGQAGETREAIYGGVADTDGAKNDGVVAVRVDQSSSAAQLCSGALIAPNVVLTARHCVSVNLTGTVNCDANGASTDGAQLGADVAPGVVHVFVGATPQVSTGAPAANGRAIFHAQSSLVCNTDMALVVLDRSISTTPLRVRTQAPVTMGEMLRAVGYGQNDSGQPIGTRFRRDGVGVLGVGKSVSASGTPLGSNEFEVGEAFCQGDSGGPTLDESTGAVVGVVSRGNGCTDTFGHVYTSLAGFGDVFRQAFMVAGGSAIDESGAEITPGNGPVMNPAPSATGTGTAPAPANTGYGYYPSGNVHTGAGGCAVAWTSPAGAGATTFLLLGGLVLARARRRRQ